MTSPKPTITADRTFLDDRDDDMSVYVETDEVDTAVRALEAASRRLRLVTFDGREYESYEAWTAADMASGGSFDTTNANYVADVERRPDGAYVVLDTKGAAPAAMGRTVLRIVTEELLERGITRARLRPVRRSDWDA